MSDHKRSKAKIDVSLERIHHRKIVIKRGVLRSDNRIPPFQFIF
jgi:hypothetical protein